MKTSSAGLGVLILLLLAVVSPAGAFTAKNLDIAVQDSADATITFSYELEWFENAAVFSRIVSPADELAKALRNQFNKEVNVISVTGNQAQFQVVDFAIEKNANGKRTLTTPSLTFKNAEKALKKYWFASLIRPDFSPEVTRVSFPDGYAVEFYNVETIPSVKHAMNG